MFGQIYFRVLGIGCFLSMALLSSAQSKLDSLHHLNEVVVTARINKEVIPVQSLSGDKLEKLAAHSVADAIRYFSGVQIKDYGGIEIDKEGRTVTVDGKVLELSLREYELLIYLVENENIALSRDKILNNVWNYDYYGDSRTIDSHIKKIRHKLGKRGKYIKTMRGVGYKFEIK